MACPKCGSDKVERFTLHALSCVACGHDGRSSEFDSGKKPVLCEGCGINRADPPSRLCPGCEAYRDHQR